MFSTASVYVLHLLWADRGMGRGCFIKNYVFWDVETYPADSSARAAFGEGLRLGAWDRGFESHGRHGFLPFVFFVCFVDSSQCDKLITRSEEFYHL